MAIQQAVGDHRVLIGQPADRTEAEIAESDVEGDASGCPGNIEGRRAGSPLAVERKGIPLVTDSEVTGHDAGRIVLDEVVTAYLPAVIVEQQAVRVETEFCGAVLLIDDTGYAIAVFIVFILQQKACCKTVIRYCPIDRRSIKQQSVAVAVGQRNIVP